MPEELHEMHEHAEHAHHDPSLAPATLTMAILAVLVAIASLLDIALTRRKSCCKIRQRTSGVSFQAKNIRLHIDEAVAASVGIVETKDAEAATKVKEKYASEAERYRDEVKEIQTKATELQDEVKVASTRANRFDLGEVSLRSA